MSAAPDRRPPAPRDFGGPFRVRLITARRGGELCVRDVPASFAAFATARGEADRLQREYDDDCAPVSVYVVGADGVPIHRGGAAR